jgi:hypothetical protein
MPSHDSPEFCQSISFLNNNRRIIDLISVANLNCRAVKVYLFSLLAELEIQMGLFVLKHLPEVDLLQLTFGASVKTKHESVRKRYEADKANGLEVSFVEYLYLSDLMNVVAAKRQFSHLGFSSRNRFEDHFNPLNYLSGCCRPPSSISDNGRDVLQETLGANRPHRGGAVHFRYRLTTQWSRRSTAQAFRAILGIF